MFGGRILTAGEPAVDDRRSLMSSGLELPLAPEPPLKGGELGGKGGQYGDIGVLHVF